MVGDAWRGKQPPRELPSGVDRAKVRAEWNNPPWRDPPPWWGQERSDARGGPVWAGGLSWPEYLLKAWRELLLTPPTPEQQRSREMIRRMGQACAEELTRAAIEVLTGAEEDAPAARSVPG